MRGAGRFSFVLLLWGATGFAELCTESSVSIVAHQDDDLLFMNPDIQKDIRESRCTVTVYVTAGDAGEEKDYWLSREKGIDAAYAAMAGVKPRWEERPLLVGGRNIVSRVLRGNERVRTVFLRLPDGGGGELPLRKGLQKLWSGEVSSLATIDGAATYSKPELIQTLKKIISLSSNKPSVRTLDFTGENGVDHTDHVHSARFAVAALAALKEINGRYYRGYNITDELPNISSMEALDKRNFFLIYSVFDKFVCKDPQHCEPPEIYAPWLDRQYGKEILPEDFWVAE